MIEILNPDLTPFDNLIPHFQAGEDGPAPPGSPSNPASSSATFSTGPAGPIPA